MSEQSVDDIEHTECAVCGYEPDADRVPPHYVLSLSDEDINDGFVQSYPFGGSLSVPFACSDECWLDAQDDPELVADGGQSEGDTGRDDCLLLFRVLFNEERTRIDTNQDVMGWGIRFPSGWCYVDWNRLAYDPDDRLDHPHVSVYGSFEDVEQGTGGDVEVFHEMIVHRSLSPDTDQGDTDDE